jgi:hypothetical protein
MNFDITEKAMLASLHISCWSARKHDKKVSQEVNDKYGGNRKAGRFNKTLASKDSLKDIQSAISSARIFHIEQTLPWGERGERLLPSKNYNEYSRQMRIYNQDFERAIDSFVAEYHQVIFDARQTLGGLFCRADYPSVDEIREKFAFRTAINPVPVAEDFRVSLAHDEVAVIQQDIENRLAESHAVAIQDLWLRLHEVVERMVERLSDPKAVFRDSLVSNILHLTELLPRLNLNDDPDLEIMRRNIETRLCQYSPAQLRTDKRVRREAADAAKNVLETMGSYMREAA